MVQTIFVEELNRWITFRGVAPEWSWSTGATRGTLVLIAGGTLVAHVDGGASAVLAGGTMGRAVADALRATANMRALATATGRI